MEMSRRCSLSPSYFSKLFTTWINFLAYELRALHKVPAANPRVLIKAFTKFPHTRVVIDCTEVFCKRPSGLTARKQLFSKYKHHNTFKFLLGISSNMWGGRASDKKSHGNVDFFANSIRAKTSWPIEVAPFRQS